MLDIALLCTALAVYYESRSDPFDDQIRVAQTIINRSREIPKYQGDVCLVAFTPAQFSDQLIPLHTPKETTAWLLAQQAASTAFLLEKCGVDLTHGALYFHNWHVLGDKPRYHRSLKYKGKSHIWY